MGREVPAEDAARAFLQHLAQSNGWLIVLDNVDEPDAIRQILPPTTGGQVLITTRARKPGLGKAKPLPVDIWSIDQATDFLLERATRDEFERPDAEQLAEALDGLPLALEQAGAFLAHHDLTIGEYLEDFQAVKLDLFDLQEPEEGNYEETVATTWEISFHKIGQASGAAVEALEACAFLAPDRIPLELFTTTEDRLGPHLGALARETTNSAISTKLIEPMTQYSLARFDNENREFSLHRLVQQVIHQRLQMSSRVASTCELVHGALNSTFPGRPQEAVNWAECARWLPHVRFNVEHWPRESKANPTALWMSAGNYAWVTGRAREANFFFESALNERLRGLGEEHPDTLISMNNLAETLRAIGEFKAARKLHEDTLKVRQRVLGQEHQDTLTSMSNLAGTLKALGEAKEAKNLLEAALKASQRTLGKEHPDTLTYMNNLAATLRVLGEGKEARNLHEHVLKGRQRSLGEKHSSTLTSMNNLASTLLALGEANEARKLLEDALKIRQLVLGEKHSSTLTPMNNLASTLLELGEANEARRLQEKALEVSQRELGHEHPDTLISMNNLAGTLKALGEVDEASRLLEDALNVSRRVRGRVHPDTLASIHNLCVLQVDTEGMDLDLDLLIELLQNVFKLPSGTPILMTVIDYWIPQTHRHRLTLTPTTHAPESPAPPPQTQNPDASAHTPPAGSDPQAPPIPEGSSPPRGSSKTARTDPPHE